VSVETRCIGWIFSVLVAAAVARADAVSSGASSPVEVTVGCYINEIYDVDLPGHCFSVNAYVWFRWDPDAWPPPSLEELAMDASQRGAVVPGAEALSDGAPTGPNETFEVIRSRDIEVKEIYRRPGYSCVQVAGTVSNHWVVDDFPFDRQRFVLQIEDSVYETSQVEYLADQTLSNLAPDLEISGCRVEGLVVAVRAYEYDTTFGDPDLAEGARAQYSRFTATVLTDRLGWQLFLKLFTGLIVATVVAMLAFMIDPMQVDPRFGVCVGGLFGIIASSYVVQSLLPDGPNLSYSDRLHIAALIAVLAVLLESTASLALKLAGDPKLDAKSRRLDRIGLAVVPACFFGYMAYATVQAVV
jgi:hypothetical protein